MNELHLCVLSYNRGAFLANCVRSLEECAPEAPVVIVDDASDDPATRDTLADLAGRHRVIDGGAASGHKHGGLYANMQLALDAVPDDALIAFVQDDTQLVRRVDTAEQAALAARFARCPGLGFITATFRKGAAVARRGGLGFDHDADLDLFFPRPQTDRSAGVYYSDVSIAHAGRLREADWRFATGEPANQAAARARFGRMGYLPCPFLMWLPNAPAYRGRTKSLTLRWAERARRCGLHPLRYMTAAEVHGLEEAALDAPPVAEDWLEPVDGPLPTPWIYDPLHGSRWLKHLNRLELLLRPGRRT